MRFRAADLSLIGLLTGVLAGCGAGSMPAGDPPLPTAPVLDLVGELHLHQFPLGGHAWAAFVGTPIPRTSISTDELVELTTQPTDSVGPCTLYLSPQCVPACQGASYCAAPNTCRPIPITNWVDGGPIEITGSRLVPTIRIWYGGPDSGYQSDPEPGVAPLFAGGETLQIHGGMGATELRGTLIAPLPVEVTAPDLTLPLHFPTDAGLAVRWKPTEADSMVLLLTASQPNGAFASIRCVTADIGSLDVPASMMKALPPAPRNIRFELERDDERVLKTVTPGQGILSHAAFSRWENGTE